MAQEEEKKERPQEGEEEWKVRFKDGTVFAPVTYDQLVEWYKSGQIDEKAPVAKNDLTAEWVEFKETEGFKLAQAAKEGRQIFCTSCGTPWPLGTKFCTKCGTFLETGEKIMAVGEKKPEATPPWAGRKKQDVAPPQAEVSPPAAGLAVEAPSAEEAAVPAKPRKRTKKKIAGLVIAVAAAVVALVILAPEKMSGIVEKVKGLVGVKSRVAKGKETGTAEWAGVREDVRTAIERLRDRISSSLNALPFAGRQKGSFEDELVRFLRGAVREFTDADAFVSLASSLSEGDLKKAAGFLEEERKLLGEGSSAPRIDAIQGAVEVLLGRERTGMALLSSVVEKREVSRLGASFCRGAVEGCFEKMRTSPEAGEGRQDPWGSIAEIIGVSKDDFGDEFLSRHCGRALVGLKAAAGLIRSVPLAGAGEAASETRKEVRTKTFGPLLSGGDPAVQAALVELGKSDPGKRPSLLNYKPVRVAYVLRLLSAAEQAQAERDQRLVDVLKEGLSADPDNAFYNYILAGVYLGMKKEAEATAEIAAGNKKSAYRDYGKERMEGLAKVLDTPLPYTTAVMTMSSPQVSALGNHSRVVLDSAWSWFRVGRRREVFDALGEWRKACERLRNEARSFRDVVTVVNAAFSLMAAEAEFYKRDGKEREAWEVRKAMADNQRVALAIEYGVEYSLPAMIFVKEVLSEKGYQEEFSKTSPREVLSKVLTKALERLDRILADGPGKVAREGVDLQDQYYVAAKTCLGEKKYEQAFEYGSACLAKNSGHVWALKVMEEALRGAAADGGLSRQGGKAVVYRVVGKRDLSLPDARRLEYEIAVAKGTSKEEAIATARSALEGFLKRDKPDAVRIYVVPEGSRLPYVRLDWAPEGDWEKAKSGTADGEFEENVKAFESDSF